MWTSNELFAKGQLYVRKALEHQAPESTEVPLFAFIALEFLARAALSQVNVALLADPKDGYNILHACGYGGKRAPISIPTKTVFHRCTVICPEFTERDYEMCMEWANYRNEELHSGATSLEDLRKSSWMPDFFRIAVILLAHMKKSLADFVGSKNEKSIVDMVSALSAGTRKETFGIIKKFREQFNDLPVEERLAKLKEGKEARHSDWLQRVHGQEVECPSCEGAAIITGELIRSTSPHDEDGELVQEDVRLPTSLHCYACGLELSGYAQLHAVNLGEQFVNRDILDVAEYYGIEFDPDEYYGSFESSYMNE